MLIAEYSVDSEFIDPNGHLAEYGYYHYAIRALWQDGKNNGRLKLFKELGVGPVTLESHSEFKSEIFKGEKILIHERNLKDTARPKLWKRTLKIVKKKSDEVSFITTSKMAFFNTLSRKIVVIPQELEKPIFQYS